MKIFKQFLDMLQKRKWLAIVLGITVVCALCAGGYFGWQEYQRRQTSQFAMEKLREALSPPNPRELAAMVDFHSLANELAKAIVRHFSFYMQGDDQERNISRMLQTALLRRFREGPPPSKTPVNEETSEVKALQEDLQILPTNFVEQMLNTMTLRENGPGAALLSVKIENSQLKKTFTLIFNMQKTPDGWIIRNIANSNEVAGQMAEAMLARHNRLREVYLEKNANTAKKMNELLPILSCSADAGLIGNGKFLVMTVHVLARNKGNIQVNNFSADIRILGKDGSEIEQRFLNTAKPVGPGEDFNHRWAFELDSQAPLAQKLLMGIPLQCRASWQTLGLNNRQVWHIEEVPNPDRICPLEGHDHPEGFCFTPVFLPEKK